MPTSSFPAAFAGGVRAERARAEMSQQALADALGWASRSLVADLEAGNRAVRLEDITPICKALGVTLADLLQRADPDELRVIGLR